MEELARSYRGQSPDPRDTVTHFDDTSHIGGFDCLIEAFDLLSQQNANL
jgi:hypothetical protein